MIIERTTSPDDSLKYMGYIYMGEHSLDRFDDGIFKPKEYAMTFCKDGVEEVLYKTRIQPTSSARLIKIFVKKEEQNEKI